MGRTKGNSAPRLTFGEAMERLTEELAIGAIAVARQAYGNLSDEQLTGIFRTTATLNDVLALKGPERLPPIPAPYGLIVVAGERNTFKSSLLREFARRRSVKVKPGPEPTADHPLSPRTTFTGLLSLVRDIRDEDAAAIAALGEETAAVEAKAEADAEASEVPHEGLPTEQAPEVEADEIDQATQPVTSFDADIARLLDLHFGEPVKRGGVVFYDGLTSLFFEITQNLGRGGVSKALKDALQAVHHMAVAAQIHLVATFNTMALDEAESEMLMKTIQAGVWTLAWISPNPESAVSRMLSGGADSSSRWVVVTFDVRNKWRAGNAVAREFELNFSQEANP